MPESIALLLYRILNLFSKAELRSSKSPRFVIDVMRQPHNEWVSFKTITRKVRHARHNRRIS